MIDLSIDQLRSYFGSDVLIGRIKSPDMRKHAGLIVAFQEDKGHPWKYPDGRLVDDIAFTIDGKTNLQKDDWVLVQEYEIADDSLGKGIDARLKAGRFELLTEVGTIKDILGSDQVISSRRLLAGAIRSVKIVGNRVLILRQFLESEHSRIEKQYASEAKRLQDWEVELQTKQHNLETNTHKLASDTLAFGSERKELQRDQTRFQEAQIAFRSRLLEYGLDVETVNSGKLQLSEVLIAFLLSQEEIRDRLKAEKIAELREVESEIDEKGQKLAASEEMLKKSTAEAEGRAKELDHKEREAQKRDAQLSKWEQTNHAQEAKLAKWEQDIQNLQDILLPTTTTKKAPAKPAPIYRFRTEEELVKHISGFVQDSGFYYDQWVLENFYTCLKTNYLVILSGISGAGKSKLPEVFARAIGGEFELVPVRPDWNDDRDLLGYFDARGLRYQSTRFIEFLIKASKDPDRLYIICLDEMNLAPVEYYFAQLLSVLEKGDPRLKPPDETLTELEVERLEERALIKMLELQDERSEVTGVAREALDREIRRLSQSLEDLERYREIPISPNVRFVGTVNVDHTTHGFSDKVLDRANVIQFERVDLSVKLSSKTPPETKMLGFSQFSQWCNKKSLQDTQLATIDEFASHVRRINFILEPAGVNIGFRVLQDIRRYMHLVIQGGSFDDPRDAFDFQIKQRILPKIRGMQSRELKESLADLAKFLEKEGYDRSHKKVAGHPRDGKRYGGMLQQLESKGYVNYWEVR